MICTGDRQYLYILRDKAIESNVVRVHRPVYSQVTSAAECIVVVQRRTIFCVASNTGRWEPNFLGAYSCHRSKTYGLLGKIGEYLPVSKRASKLWL